ncbi:MAG: hypothetical protein RJA35_498 [Actinomycetota bacterium]|jgi:Flp pilus assembly protein TadG
MRDDRGSALPLFLFGVAFLLAVSTLAVTASGYLLQQRRLNGITDSMALYLLAETGSKKTPPADAVAAQLQVLYPNQGISIDQVKMPDADSSWVRLCQPNRMVISVLFSGATICVASAAQRSS